MVCIASDSRQRINSRTKRTDARQRHAFFFEKLDQLLREQHVLSYVRSANRRMRVHLLTPRLSPSSLNWLVAYLLHTSTSSPAKQTMMAIVSPLCYIFQTHYYYLFLYNTLDVPFLDISYLRKLPSVLAPDG